MFLLILACAPGSDDPTASNDVNSGTDPTEIEDTNGDDINDDTADDTNSEEGDSGGTIDGCTNVPEEGYTDVFPAQEWSSQTEYDVLGSAVYGCTDRWFFGVDFGQVSDYPGVVDYVQACNEDDCNGTSDIHDWTSVWLFSTPAGNYVAFFPVNSADELVEECGEDGGNCFGRLHMTEQEAE